MKIHFILLSAIFITSQSVNEPDCDNVDQSDILGRYGDNLYSADPFIADPNDVGTPCPLLNFGIAGSSTVYPIARAWATEYNTCSAKGCALITVEGLTSTDGAERVCGTVTVTDPKKVDIGYMSRQFEVTEALPLNGYTYACLNQPILVTQIPIATDGIKIVVKKDGAAHQCIEAMSNFKGLTLAQLRYIFSNLDREHLRLDGLQFDSILLNDNRRPVKQWDDFSKVDACKLGKIKLYGPNEESGTYSLFNDTIFNPFDLYISKYASETFDDMYIEFESQSDIVQAVKDDEYAIAFVNYVSVQFEPELADIPIGDSQEQGYLGRAPYRTAPIHASPVTIQDGTYPISRPMYMNVNNEALKTNKEVFDYLQYGLSKDKGEGQDTIYEVLKQAKLSDEDHKCIIDRINKKGETVFTHWLGRECGDLGGGVTNEFESKTPFDCGAGGDYEMVRLVGSSTVFPVATQWGCNYVDKATYKDKCHKVSVSGSDSKAGAVAVCDGSADIAAMSRPFKTEEAIMEPEEPFTYTCAVGDKRVTQIEIGLDGMTIFVNSALKECLANLGGLSLDELQYIFSSRTHTELSADLSKDLSRITETVQDKKYWSDLGSSCPANKEIKIYGPDDNSGTQALFFEKIFDLQTNPSETFYSSVTSTPVKSEVDSVITIGVRDDPDPAIGLVGFTAFKAQEPAIVAIQLHDFIDLAIFVKSGTDIALAKCLDNLGGLSFDELQYIFSSRTYDDLNNDQMNPNDLSRIKPMTAFPGNEVNLKYWSDFFEYSSCPNEEIKIYGPADNTPAQGLFFDEIFDSGTETFYSTATSQVVKSETDSVITNGVINDVNGIGIGIVGFTGFKAQKPQLVDIPLHESSKEGPFIGLDGMTIFVKSVAGNGLAECLADLGGLSFDELQYIFSDRVYEDLNTDQVTPNDLSRITAPAVETKKYWIDLGSSCPSDEIKIYAHENSATQASFFEKIFDNPAEAFYNMESGAELFAVDSEITNAVIDGDIGIGIVSDTAFQIAKAQEPLLVGIPLFITPTEDNIRDESYPLTRSLYMNVAQSQWKVKPVREYMEYAFGLIGEEIVRETLGFVTLPTDRLEIMKTRFGGGNLEDVKTVPVPPPAGGSIQPRKMMSRLLEMKE